MATTEELSLSLIREFLSSKRLRGTLAKLDEEMPRTLESINNRVVLSRILNMEQHILANTLESLRKWERTVKEELQQDIFKLKEMAHAVKDRNSEQPGSLELTRTESPSPYNSMLEVLVTSVIDQQKPPQKQTDSGKICTDGKPITLEEHPPKLTPAKDDGSTDQHSLETEAPASKPTALDHIFTSGTRPSRGKMSISGLPLKGTGELPSFLTSKEREEPSLVSNKMTIRRASDYLAKGTASPWSLHNKQEVGFTPPPVKKGRPRLDSLKTPPSSHAISPPSISQEVHLSQALKTDSIAPFLHTPSPPTFNLSAAPSPPIFNLTSALSPAPSPGQPHTSRPAFVSTMDMPPNEPPKLVKYPQAAQDLFARTEEDMLCEDLEDFDMNSSMPMTSNSSLNSTQIFKVPNGAMISAEDVQALKEVLFGVNSSKLSFNKEWEKQNLVFCKVAQLEYGLVQHKGGPCGVLASLQAHILKYLMFEDEHQPDRTTSPCPTVVERKNALVGAMTEIIWRAGSHRRGVVTLLAGTGRKTAAQGLLQSNDIISKMNVYSFQAKELLKQFIENLLMKFMGETSSGCLCFTLSVILSRGVRQVRGDMDDASSTLIGSYNYCTQELVNLMLTGLATSNVFDGEMSMEATGGEKLVLKGINSPSDIGFLSLFEFHGSCQVGNHFKNPTYPIFVICCESHFIVLFSLKRNLMQDTSLQDIFDLYYYDSLANQRDVIRLTVHCEDDELKQSLGANELSPPIELCIKTRWRSTIQWNETEQLL